MFARVVFPLPLPRTFIYRVPREFEGRIHPGMRVTVPLGRKKQQGFIVALDGEPPGPEIEVKDIDRILDDRPLWGASYIKFIRKLASEFHSSGGEFLQASLPPSLAARTRLRVRLTDAGRLALAQEELTKKEAEVAGLLAGGKGFTPLHLQRKTGIRHISSLLGRMEKKGLVDLEREEIPRVREAERTPQRSRQLDLGFGVSRGERTVLATVEDAVDKGVFASCYVCGSDESRFEVYGRLAERALARSGKVLFLVPEISMTGDIVPRVNRRAGRRPIIFHGGLTPRQKEEAWRALQSGKASVVAGTRSGLFVDPDPFRLIIVEGEHDEAYHQAESPSYDARRGAFLRAAEQESVVVYGSARPTVEAFHSALKNKVLLELGQSVRKSKICWVDHRSSSQIVSPDLRVRIKSALGKSEPVILFLNRRGLAATFSCAGCGHIPRCPRCDIPAVQSGREEELLCRYCAASIPSEERCPSCGGSYLRLKGTGIVALEEELKTLFPDVPVARFDSDAVPGQKDQEQILRQFSRGRIPLLIGTRLLSYRKESLQSRLLGILSPESHLGFSDYRAAQRTYQSVAQMMDLLEDSPEAEVVVQTPQPSHYAVRAAVEGDYRTFYDQEISFRRAMTYPPFAAFAEVAILGREVRPLAAKARALAKILREFEPDIEVLGPALKFVSRIRGESRIQIILKAGKRKTIDEALGAARAKIRSKVAVDFSYSPMSPPGHE